MKAKKTQEKFEKGAKDLQIFMDNMNVIKTIRRADPKKHERQLSGEWRPDPQRNLNLNRDLKFNQS